MSVRLSVPAEPIYAAVVRTVAMSMAAQATIDGDGTQDARLLVDEIFNMLLTVADLPTQIDYTFNIDAPHLIIEARVTSPSSAALKTDTVQWRVLHSLAPQITARHGNQQWIIEASVTSRV
jgi:hypothetical protein